MFVVFKCINSKYFSIFSTDAECPTGQYGRECHNSCNCAKNGENCFVSTGGCPSGCAAGYHLEGCQIRKDIATFLDFLKVFYTDLMRNCID